MNKIENLVDESGMITTKKITINNQSKADFYNYLKKINLNRFPVVFMRHRRHGLIHYWSLT